MPYVVFGESDIGKSDRLAGIVRIFLDLDDRGRPKREVALDADGKVVHRFPDRRFKEGTYGMFDGTFVSLTSGEGEISKAAFEEAWNRGDKA